MNPESLDLPALHCSLDETLGDYYQDVSPAIDLVESGYHGGFDDHGVAVIRLGDHGSVYNATIPAQYALANMLTAHVDDQRRQEIARIQLDWLVSNQATAGCMAGCWVVEYDNPKYTWLRQPWTSSMASGNAISALLRGWQQFGDDRYRAAADRGYEALHDPRTALVISNGDELWYEEYPGNPPLHVLNGHIYSLLGVVDYARVTADAGAHARWRRAAATTLAHLDDFDLGFWSAYDLRFREPVSLHYQKNVHVPLLRILAALTGEERFTTVADRWERQFRSPLSRARLQIALRVHGRRKRRSAAAAAAGTVIELRPFPYPFRAALAICNDADALTVANFTRLYRFLTTSEQTEWGPGLSLPVGGSFFMFSSEDSPNTFTVFDRLSDTITAGGEFILDCARRGVLDVLHTYGCFTDERDFNRQLARRALDTLRERGITIETWVNHGPPSNVQCLGSRHGWQGDIAGAPGYHADLLVDHGVRWVWTGSEIVDEFVLDAVRPNRRRRNGQALVEPYTLRDGQEVRHFFRYGGNGALTPVLDDLPEQLSRQNLDGLVREGGYAIVYQHLAVRRVRPGFGADAYGPVDDAWFRPDELAVLRDLARRRDEGEIWVAPTTHLLRYHDARTRLRWEVRREDEGDLIVISDPVHAEDLANFTFYCNHPERTRVAVQSGHGLQAITETRSNPADANGRESITILPSRGARLDG